MDEFSKMDEFSDDGLSVSSQQMEIVKKMQLKRKNTEEIQIDELLAGNDVLDEDSLEQAQRKLLDNSRSPSRTFEERMEEDEGEWGQQGEMEEGELRDETYSSMDSSIISQQQGNGSHPRRTLFGGPPYNSYGKFNPSNAHSDGPMDFGGGMDLSLLSGSQNSSMASANNSTPIMSAASAVRAMENNKNRYDGYFVQNRRRPPQKAYVRIREPKGDEGWDKNGVGGIDPRKNGQHGTKTTARNNHWGPRTPPLEKIRNESNDEEEREGNVQKKVPNSAVINSNSNVSPPELASNSSSSSKSATPIFPAYRQRAALKTPLTNGASANFGEKQQNPGETGNVANGKGPEGNKKANGGNGHKKEQNEENKHNTSSNNSLLISGALNLQLVDVRNEEEEENGKEGEVEQQQSGEVDEKEKHAPSKWEMENEETNDDNENDEPMANNNSNSNQNLSSLNLQQIPQKTSWMFADNFVKQNAFRIGNNHTEEMGERNGDENEGYGSRVVWMSGFDENLDGDLLWERMAEYGTVLKINIEHMTSSHGEGGPFRCPCTIAFVEYEEKAIAKLAHSYNNGRIWEGYRMKCGFSRRIELKANNRRRAGNERNEGGENSMGAQNNGHSVSQHRRSVLHQSAHQMPPSRFIPSNFRNYARSRPAAVENNMAMEAAQSPPRKRTNFNGQRFGGTAEDNQAHSSSPLFSRGRSMGAQTNCLNAPRAHQNQNNNETTTPRPPTIRRNSRWDQWETGQQHRTRANGQESQWNESASPSPPTAPANFRQNRQSRVPIGPLNGEAGSSGSGAANQNQPPSGIRRQFHQGPKKDENAEQPIRFF